MVPTSQGHQVKQDVAKRDETSGPIGVGRFNRCGRPVDDRFLPPQAFGATWDRLGAYQRGRRVRYSTEGVRFIYLFAALDFLPILQNLGAVLDDDVAKHMGVAAHERVVTRS